MLKSLFPVLIIFFSLTAFGEEGEDDISGEDDIAEQAREYRKTQKRAHKNLGRANDALEITDQLEVMGREGLSAVSIMDEKIQAQLQKLLASGVLSNQSHESIRTDLLDKFKGTRMEVFFKRFPGAMDTLVDIMRDKEALPGMIRMIGRKKELKRYGIICLSVMIFSFLFRRFWLKKRLRKKSFVERNFISLGVSLIFTAATLLIFYSMFKTDIHPTVAILGRHLFA